MGQQHITVQAIDRFETILQSFDFEDLENFKAFGIPVQAIFKYGFKKTLIYDPGSIWIS